MLSHKVTKVRLQPFDRLNNLIYLGFTCPALTLHILPLFFTPKVRFISKMVTTKQRSCVEHTRWISIDPIILIPFCWLVR